MVAKEGNGYMRGGLNLTGASVGFTLIELLVVIAIIGMLASVVLASVGSARTKGADASVKAQLSNMRAAAELYATNNATANSYAGVCTAVSSVANPGINDMLKGVDTAIAGVTGVVIYTSATHVIQVAGNVTCVETTGAWVAQGSLSNYTASTVANPGYWCVDSAGASKAEVAVLPANATVCT